MAVFDITPVTLEKSQKNWPLVTEGHGRVNGIKTQWLMAVHLPQAVRDLR